MLGIGLGEVFRGTLQLCPESAPASDPPGSMRPSLRAHAHWPLGAATADCRLFFESLAVRRNDRRITVDEIANNVNSQDDLGGSPAASGPLGIWPSALARDRLRRQHDHPKVKSYA